MKNEKLTAVDLFAGAGGLTEGMKLAGIDVRLAIEKEPSACLVYALNQSAPHLCKDVKEIKRFISIIHKLGMRQKDVDIIAGGPPCQGFSLANIRTRGESNGNSSLILEFVRAVKEMHPPAFVLENVVGLQSIGEGRLLKEIISSFETLGYDVSCKILNAADFGVPQIRKRIFVTGCLYGKPQIPKATHGPKADKKYITVEDAIMGDVPPLNGTPGNEMLEYCTPPRSKFQRYVRRGCSKVYDHIATRNREKVRRRISLIPPGASLCDLMKEGKMPEDLVIKVDHKSVYRRLHPSQPSVTVGNFRKAMLIHPVEDRLLSLREAARLQSFQDRYRFPWRISYMQQHVGDAVPPLMAKAVFKEMRKLFQGIGEAK